MASRTFKQGDYGYVHGISMYQSGCGASALACVVHNIDTSINPKKVANWLYDKGHFYSSGTTRTGITLALEHYGFEIEGYYKPEHTGGSVWKQAVNKMKSLSGDWWAIVLTVGKSNGAKDNFWTSGGHYLAITDLKNNKVYVRDSGARNNTGYFDLERLRYDTNVIWIFKKKSLKKTYKGEFPTLSEKGYLIKGDKGTDVKRLELFLAWLGYYLDVIDTSFGNKLDSAVRAFQKDYGLVVDGSFGSKSLAKAKTVVH